MNNKPVAIVKKLILGGGDNFIIERFVSLKEGTLLYTTPQITELSDEEIDRIEFVGYKLGEPITDEALRNFARAILRKAQEK